MLLGNRTVMEARALPELVQSVATMTKLTAATVRRRIQNENGKSLLRNAFAERWPGLIEELGDASVSQVRDDAPLLETIAGMLALPVSQVRRRLAAAHGRKIVRNEFGEQWLDPTTFARDQLGDLNARVAREYGFTAAIARATGAEQRHVQRKLLAAHGRVLVRTLFKEDWPGMSGHNSVHHEGNARHREGEVLADRYQLTRYLGMGGYGEVWLVNDLTLGFPVRRVLKFDQRGSVRALQRELQRADHLTHPHICKYVDVQRDEKSDEAFIVMVYAGETLRSLLRSGAPISVTTAVSWTRALAEALDFAHAQGIVHRDVSPMNVVVDERQVIRLIDFGVAHEIGSTAASTTGTRPTTLTSTYGCNLIYGAPEILSGGTAVPATDQYSLALVFSSMLDGRVFEERVPEYRSRVLSPRANAALRRALTVHPADRFTNCSAFAEALP